MFLAQVRVPALIFVSELYLADKSLTSLHCLSKRRQEP